MTRLILEETVQYPEGNIYSGIKWSDEDSGARFVTPNRSAFTRSDFWQEEIGGKAYRYPKEGRRKNMNSDCDYDVELREREGRKIYNGVKPRESNYATSSSPNESNWMLFRWDVKDTWLPEDGEPTEIRDSTEDDFCSKKWLTID